MRVLKLKSKRSVFVANRLHPYKNCPSYSS
uniref:Uncharacterized protein n=1 Tax=Anguilla anguilla TaxID=7936 RepID=A0A0E9QG81_ANGAN